MAWVYWRKSYAPLRFPPGSQPPGSSAVGLSPSVTHTQTDPIGPGWSVFRGQFYQVTQVCWTPLNELSPSATYPELLADPSTSGAGWNPRSEGEALAFPVATERASLHSLEARRGAVTSVWGRLWPRGDKRHGGCVEKLPPRWLLWDVLFSHQEKP